MFNFKKILLSILILVVIFMFISCDNKTSNTLKPGAHTYEDDNYVESCVFDLNYISSEACFEEVILPNEDIAKQYADLIFENLLKKKLADYKVTSIGFDSNKCVWIIMYGIDEESIGGDINIALSQKNGEVLRIWFGE